MDETQDDEVSIGFTLFQLVISYAVKNLLSLL